MLGIVDFVKMMGSFEVDAGLTKCIGGERQPFSPLSETGHRSFFFPPPALLLLLFFFL
jgi:hypothetical protein